MDIPELVGIADQLGIKVTPNDQMEDVVYAILDKAAENSAIDESPKKKRTRIAKKDTSKVYTVKGEDGENLDSKSNRKKKTVETPSLFGDLPVAEAPAEEPAPKKRGRKSKAEKEAEEAAAAAATAAEAQAEPEESDANDMSEVIPEAANFDISPDEDAANAIAQLREKMSARKEQAPATNVETDEGTDFITILDIPIEDQAASPTLDIFDRPMVQQPLAGDPVMPARQAQVRLRGSDRR